MAKIKLAVLLGTTRKDNKSQHVARYVTKIANQGDVFEATLVDPAELNLPGDGNDEHAKDPRYTKITAESEAFFIVAPEYNHSFSGSLKRMLDSELKNYIHKPVAIAGVSSGRFSGVRAIHSLVPVLREIGMVTTFNDVFIAGSYEAFNDNDEPTDEHTAPAVVSALEELEWLAKTLKYGRENLPNKHHTN